MGTKYVQFNVEVEIEKELYYTILEDPTVTPLEFLALFAGSVAEPNYDQVVEFEGLV